MATQTPVTPEATSEAWETYAEEPVEHDGDLEEGEERVRHRKHKARKLDGQDISHLNLTPMMDIMTMLLVFLVKSFAEEPNNINVSLSMRPPASTSEPLVEAATRVMVTKEEILVNDRLVMSVEEAKSAKLSTAWLPALRDSLLEEKDHLDALHRMGGDEFDGELLVVADETTPYSLVTAVLVTAGESQYRAYKLVVMPGATPEKKKP